MGKTKKQLEQIVLKKEKKVRQYRSRQGRSDRQYESSMKVMTGVCVLFLVTIVCYGIVNTIINVLG
jgi:hypothetical protein